MGACAGQSDTRRLRQRVGPRVFVLALIGAPACGAGSTTESGEDGASGSGADSASTAGSGETGDDGDGGTSTEWFSVDCESATTFSAGTREGTLAFAARDGVGACGGGGPVVFAGVRPEIRADVILTAAGAEYEPRLGAWLPVCEAGPVLACSTGLPLIVPDLAAGTELRVGIGVAPDDPVLAPEVDPSALAFRLRVELRPVLAEGEACVPWGRCEAGTACRDDGEGVQRCARLDADTCASAQPVLLDPVAGASADLEISSQDEHTDAHNHGCAGAHTAERVFTLSTTGPLPPTLEVRVTTTTPGAALALRAPGCLPEHEIACEAGFDAMAGTPVVAEPVTIAADAFADPDGESVFVFVERPEPDAGMEPANPPTPVAVRIEVVDA